MLPLNIDPPGLHILPASSDYFHTYCSSIWPSVDTFMYVQPNFSTYGKTKQILSENNDHYWWDYMGVSEWIIDDTCLVLLISLIRLCLSPQALQYRLLCEEVVFLAGKRSADIQAGWSLLASLCALQAHFLLPGVQKLVKNRITELPKHSASTGEEFHWNFVYCFASKVLKYVQTRQEITNLESI